ncbi:MAG: hypothetical protein ACTSO9_11920 [Candidatus Helarchaeota archaeon]
MKEKYKFIILLILAITIGLVTGLIFGYITGMASSALGIVNFEENREV